MGLMISMTELCNTRNLLLWICNINVKTSNLLLSDNLHNMMLSLGCKLGMSPCLAMLLLYNKGAASLPARKVFILLHRKLEDN